MDPDTLAQHIDLAIARLDGMRDGLAHARSLIAANGNAVPAIIATLPARVAAVADVAPAIAATVTDYYPDEVVAPKPRRSRGSGNRPKSENDDDAPPVEAFINRVRAAGERRLKIARMIAEDGPISIKKISDKLGVPYHQVHGTINRHEWFEFSKDDRKMHLTPVGVAAVRAADGRDAEEA